MDKLLITGATGQLGRLVIRSLLKSVPASHIIAAARNKDKAADLTALGITVREADYEKPETLTALFEGVSKVLLISSSEVGKRFTQHKAVITAAKNAGVKLLAYTSVLHADTSLLGLADEHRQTEEALRTSGVPFVLLRNGWYTENYMGSIPMALQHGALLGSANEGRISSATRQDFAEAAVAVLTSGENQAGKIYELAGDESYTLTDLAAEISGQTGKTVIYNNLPEADYKAILVKAGLPEGFAALIAQSDASASQGALFDDKAELSRLIGSMNYIT